MASISKRKLKSGAIRYVAQVRRRGMKPLNRTFKRLAAARKWAQDVEAAFESGELEERFEAEQVTLKLAIDRYIAEILPTALKRERYRVDRRKHLDFWIVALGANQPIQQITPALLVKTRQKLIGRGLKPSSVNKYVAALSAVLSRCAGEWGWLESNAVVRMKYLPESRGRLRFLSEDERKRLLAACRESRDRRLYPLVVFALATGARQGELMGLRWSDVNGDRATLTDTKNGETRSIRFPGAAGEVLRSMPQHIGGYVFGIRGSKQPWFPRKPWVKAVAAAQLQDFKFHDLRHTFASYLAMQGASLIELKEALGHRTIAMTAKYAHLTRAHSEKIQEEMVKGLF